MCKQAPAHAVPAQCRRFRHARRAAACHSPLGLRVCFEQSNAACPRCNQAPTRTHAPLTFSSAPAAAPHVYSRLPSTSLTAVVPPIHSSFRLDPTARPAPSSCVSGASRPSPTPPSSRNISSSKSSSGAPAKFPACCACAAMAPRLLSTARTPLTARSAAMQQRFLEGGRGLNKAAIRPESSRIQTFAPLSWHRAGAVAGLVRAPWRPRS